MRTSHGSVATGQPLADGLRHGRREWLFRGSQISLGRGRGRHIRLKDDELVSDLHALIERTDTGYVLRDFRSTNGTHVDGRPVGAEGVVLRLGMRVEIGGYALWTCDESGRAPILASTVTELCKGLIRVYGSARQAAIRMGRSREFVRSRGLKR